MLEEGVVDGGEGAAEELIDGENANDEEGATGDFWKGEDAAEERDEEVELDFDFEGPGDEEEGVVLAVVD